MHFISQNASDSDETSGKVKAENDRSDRLEHREADLNAQYHYAAQIGPPPIFYSKNK